MGGYNVVRSGSCVNLMVLTACCYPHFLCCVHLKDNPACVIMLGCVREVW